MVRKPVPVALLEYFLGGPESSIQENRIKWLAGYLCSLVVVQEQPTEPEFRAEVEAKWAEIMVQNYHKPAFSDDLKAAIDRLNNGSLGVSRKHCLAVAYMILCIYGDWWNEPQFAEAFQTTGIKITFGRCFSVPPEFSDKSALILLSKRSLKFLAQLNAKYGGQINTYTVRLFAQHLWQQNNHPDLEAPELPLNDQPSRTQWSRWFDELGLDEKVLPRSTGGRGK